MIADFVRTEGVEKETARAVSTSASIHIDASRAFTSAILRETPAARLTRAGALPDLFEHSRPTNLQKHGPNRKGEVHRPVKV